MRPGKPGVLCWLLVLLALLAGAPLAAQVATVGPRDDAGRDPSFARFRSELLTAVERQDTALVLGILTEDVLPGFGADGGIEGFRRRWLDGDLPPEESLWTVLEAVLRGGGVLRDDSTFVAPYAYAKFPDDLDPFGHGVVTGTGVRVRAAPSLGGEVLASLRHAVVPVVDWGERPEADGYRWVPIRLADGRRGYVADRYLRSPLDYRAVFVRRGGRWRLRSLVAGD